MANLKEEFARLCQIVAQLRAPGGCPWDREQTHDSLAPKLLEEAYEVVHAIRENDEANLREELGDVLLLVVMQAEIAREAGRFSIGEILHEVTEKLIRRHPHVFGDSEVSESEGVVRQWEAIKHGEKTRKHYLEGVAAALPALMRAEKIQKKAARVHFDWNNVADVIAKVDEELGEAKAAVESGDREQITDEIGDLLFAVTNLARKCDLDAESTLRSATDKFVTRFNELEDRVRASGKQLGDLPLEQLDEIWNAIKADR
ncbi:MAG: nucleoside triphosphate pyrophosphohydrolase [Chthoniobacterales bacterium]